jgi:hypothetical protein
LAAKMPKYIIHVGPQKTGSTYIQGHLFHSRKFLYDKGVLYPDVWLREGETTHYSLAEGLRVGKDLKADFDKINVEDVNTVILSCEALGGPAAPALERLREYIGTNPVEIVYYLRRWSDRMPSFWRESVVSGGKHETFLDFYTRATQTPGAQCGIRRAEINYSVMLGRYEAIFGRESLKLVSFSNLVDHGIDLFTHFCEVILGINGIPKIQNDVKRNVGAEMTETEIIRALNYMYYTETSRRDRSMYTKWNILNKQNKLGDLQRLREQMKTDVREFEIRDKNLFLRPLYEAISAYQDRLVSPEYGREVFKRRNARVQFIGPNYLFRKGAVDEVERLFHLVNSANLDSLVLQRSSQQAAIEQVAV